MVSSSLLLFAVFSALPSADHWPSGMWKTAALVQTQLRNSNAVPRKERNDDSGFVSVRDYQKAALGDKLRGSVRNAPISRVVEIRSGIFMIPATT